MNTLDYILKRDKIDSNQELPIHWPYRRNELAKLFAELGFIIGAEIGVDRGHFSYELCKANPKLRLYCIDPWKVYHKYDDIKSEKAFARNYAHTVKLLEPFDCRIIRKSSMGAIDIFEPETLDFVYIDGNHRYEYVLQDITEWTKKVRKGGIIAGHDYKAKSRKYKNPNPGVGQAVDEYVAKNNIKPWFWMIKKNDSSWFWIK